jgi:hypothetical protein
MFNSAGEPVERTARVLRCVYIFHSPVSTPIPNPANPRPLRNQKFVRLLLVWYSSIQSNPIHSILNAFQTQIQTSNRTNTLSTSPSPSYSPFALSLPLLLLARLVPAAIILASLRWWSMTVFKPLTAIDDQAAGVSHDCCCYLHPSQMRWIQLSFIS